MTKPLNPIKYCNGCMRDNRGSECKETVTCFELSKAWEAGFRAGLFEGYQQGGPIRRFRDWLNGH